MKTFVVMIGLLLIGSRGLAQQPPVDKLTQCLAMVELVVKDRANAQMEAAYFATRTKALMEENEALKAKVKELEPKKEPKK